MIEIRHLINIYISLYNYKKQLIEKKLDTDAEEIQDTINFILEKKITEITPLGKLPLQ